MGELVVAHRDAVIEQVGERVGVPDGDHAGEVACQRDGEQIAEQPAPLAHGGVDPLVAGDRRCLEGDTGRRCAFVAERGEAELEGADGGLVLVEADAIGAADAAAQAGEVVAHEVQNAAAQQQFGAFERSVRAGGEGLSRESLIEREGRSLCYDALACNPVAHATAVRVHGDLQRAEGGASHLRCGELLIRGRACELPVPTCMGDKWPAGEKAGRPRDVGGHIGHHHPEVAEHRETIAVALERRELRAKGKPCACRLGHPPFGDDAARPEEQTEPARNRRLGPCCGPSSGRIGKELKPWQA